MNQFIQLSNKEREEALLAASLSHSEKLPAFIIEKDFWICQILKIIFTVIEPKLGCVEPALIFKGGTSLSKCFNLINRMSEDIDLSFSLELLECSNTVPSNDAKNKIIDSFISDMAKKSKIFVEDILTPELKNSLSLLDNDIRIEIESQFPLNLAIYYPQSLSKEHYANKTVKPRVLLETGGRSNNYPIERTYITHMLGDCISFFEEEKFNVIALKPERTVVEKMYATHELILKSENRDGVKLANKYARHLYDIWMIYENDKENCFNIKLHKDNLIFQRLFYRKSQDACCPKFNGKFRLVPTGELYKLYKKDWNNMDDLFPNGQLPWEFDEMIKKMTVIELELNKRLDKFL